MRRLIEAYRLVTVVGAGGIGKTRVAQALAHALRDRYPDGVWVVELASLADPALLPGSVAQALGLQLRGQRPPRDELIAVLESQQLLLVLDNCEHLLDATSLLAQALLDKVPAARVLVTSQEPLKLGSEHLFRLGPWRCPMRPARCEAQAALGFGAVRLFVERVHALDPRFVFDAQNVAAVVDVCSRLDGLALAIELAAARVPSLGVWGVRARLGERLRVLTAGSRVALRRHQTLRAALDWSHGLLDRDEQAVFRRLGVFSGGCTIEAAQQVASDAQLDDWAVLDIVARLVDKSLVVADGDQRPRYRLLESARAYALERLAAAGEADLLARRHAEFYAAQFERWADALFAGALSEDAFIAARGLELDNLRAAMAWALGAAGDTDVALRLLAHSAPLALLLPLYGEGDHWLRLLAERIGSTVLSPQQCALHALAKIHWGLQRLRLPQQGSEALDVDRAALRPLADPRRQARALTTLAIHATWRGDVDLARAALRDIDLLDAAHWSAEFAALHLHTTIGVQQMAGDSASAAAALGEALARLQSAGAGGGRGAFMIRTDLAVDQLLQGRFEDAAQRLQALAELGRRQRRDVVRMGFLLAPLVLALVELDRLAEARQVVLEALPPLQRTGMWSDCAPILALFAFRRGRADTAARLLGAGDAHLARAGVRRSLLERRTEQRVLALLEAAHPQAQWRAWIAEGATLDGEAFARLVIDES